MIFLNCPDVAFHALLGQFWYSSFSLIPNGDTRYFWRSLIVILEWVDHKRWAKRDNVAWRRPYHYIISGIFVVFPRRAMRELICEHSDKRNNNKANKERPCHAT